jgi:hypothetical protein
MDSIVIIAVRFGTGILYVLVWIIFNNRIHTETYNTPVPDLTAMITIEYILRHTIVLYVSVYILLLS